MKPLWPIIPLIAAALLPAGNPVAAQENIEVVCTLPHLGAIAREVGGDRVNVTVLASPNQNPHYVTPTTQLMARTNRADLFVELGLSLEIWSPNVLDGARNPAVRVGAPGHVLASKGIQPLEVPTVVDRAQGDVHPSGNPHVWLNPLNGKVLARNIADGLIRVDPAGEETYRAKLEVFNRRIDEAFFGPELVDLLGPALLLRLHKSGQLASFLKSKKYQGKLLEEYAGGWLKRTLPYRGSRFVAYHQSWIYLSQAFGLEVAAHMESKPGIPPSTAHLEAVEELMKREGIGLVVTAPYHDVKRAQRLAERVGAKAETVLTEPEGDYLGLFDGLLDKMLPHLAQRSD